MSAAPAPGPAPGILIIDDEPGIRTTLGQILEDEDYTVFTAEDAVRGIEILGVESIGLVFLDVLLPHMGGLEALRRIRSLWPRTEVVMISGHGNIDMAVRAVKAGAFDFLEKPLSLDRVLTLCRNALTLRRLREENESRGGGAPRVEDDITGSSPLIAAARALIRQAAESDARVLITGENGTGKELAARAIHRLSARAGGPFVAVNCAAIPEPLIESELFGHEKGAFTDAVSTRKGRFETADGGVLFLDEVGDMSPPAQAKMLRAIQEQKIERVGGDATISVDVRVVAATNQDLEAAVRDGRFRQDLFFRLNVIPVRMPALRERPGDIPLLLYRFLEEFGRPVDFDAGARDLLTTYPWPGNIRELKNFAERVAVLRQGESLVTRDDAADLLGAGTGAGDADAAARGAGGDALATLGKTLDEGYADAKEAFEKIYLQRQLAKHHGVIAHTAEAIGIYPSNLHAKLKKYGLLAP